MRPFHVQCPITNKSVCFCNKQSLKNGIVDKNYRKMAYELQLHYEGYPEDILERVHDKMQFERERLQNIKHKEYIDTFDKFIEFPDENELAITQVKEPVVENNQNKTSQSHCAYCKCLLDNNLKFSKDQVPLCHKCSQDYVSGLIGETGLTMEKKRVAKQLDKMFSSPQKIDGKQITKNKKEVRVSSSGEAIN